ncbi:N-acetyltransferase esco2 [Podila humilis]|nr:N-acetyltransferase esco2 [Podila humilis]
MSSSNAESTSGQSSNTPTRVYKIHKTVKNTYGRSKPSTDLPLFPDPWNTSSLATTPTRSNSFNSTGSSPSTPRDRSRLSASFQDLPEVWTPTTKGTRTLTDEFAKSSLDKTEGSSNNYISDEEKLHDSQASVRSSSVLKNLSKGDDTSISPTPTRRRSARHSLLKRSLPESDNDAYENENAADGEHADSNSKRVLRSTYSSPSTPPSPNQRLSRQNKVVVPLLTPANSSLSSTGISSNTDPPRKQQQQATISSFFMSSASKGTGLLKGRTTAAPSALKNNNNNDSDNDKNTSPTANRTSQTTRPTNPAKKLEQLFLAFSKDRTKSSQSVAGQGAASRHRETDQSKRYHCPQCGMPYVRGQPEDEQIHDRYHRAAVGGIDYPGYKNEVVVARFIDHELEQSILPSSALFTQAQHGTPMYTSTTTTTTGTSTTTTIATTTTITSSPPSLGDSRIVMISMSENGSNFEKKKVKEVLELVNKELGSVEFSPEKLEGCKVFLYISGKRKKVVGCVIAERIKQGFEIIMSNDALSMQQAPSPSSSSSPSPSPSPSGQKITVLGTELRNSSALFCSTVPQPAICGINRIWVSSLYRRHKIASRLLDAVRDRFIYACKLELQDLAFSQPTGDGKELARRYLGTNKFLVYVE